MDTLQHSSFILPLTAFEILRDCGSTPQPVAEGLPTRRVERVWLEPGDVLFFWSHWLHRAPSPPAEGSSRLGLFGVCGAAGTSEGKPHFRHEFF